MKRPTPSGKGRAPAREDRVGDMTEDEGGPKRARGARRDRLERALHVPAPDSLGLPPWQHWVFSGVLLLVAFGSLYLAYRGFTSDAWLAAYGPDGWLFEGLRVTVGVLVTLFVVGCIYVDETSELLPFGARARGRSRVSRRARVAFCAWIGVAAVFVIGHHLVIGPRELAREIVAGTEWLDSWTYCPRECVAPYLAYSGYSVVAMIFIQFTLIGVTWLGGGRDLRKTGSYNEKISALLEPIVRQDRLAQDRADGDRKGGGEQKALHAELCLMAGALTQHARRASYLLLLVGILWFVEWNYCWETLSWPGKVFALIGYGLIASGAGTFLLSYVQYERAFHKVVPVLAPDSYAKGGRFHALRPLHVLWRIRSLSLAAFALSAFLAGPWLWGHVQELWDARPVKHQVERTVR
jgi:hypothetical protein